MPVTPKYLADFLLARIAEREQVAQAAATRVKSWPKVQPRPWDRARVIASGPVRAPLEAFEGRETPEEVLAECASKRQIVEMHRDDHGCPDRSGMDSYTWFTAPRNPNCATLLALVLPYADHPECHPSWLPPGPMAT